MKVLPSQNPEPFTITDQYLWLPDLCSLPAIISYDVTCMDEKDEFLPCFSYSRAEWNSPACDALSWYTSPHKDDFTFRTELFRNFPKVERLADPFRPTVGKKFHVTCDITATSATYFINGEPYAKATYNDGDVPSQGYFGFATYGSENIQVENVSVGAKVMQPA